MTWPIPSRRYSFCPTPPLHALADHRLFSIIAKTALRNSNRFIKLQTPHFANRSESHTCKLPGGIGPKFSTNVRMVLWPSIAPSIRRRARRPEDSPSRATRNVGRRPVTTARQQRRSAGGSAKTMLPRPIESSPSQCFSGLRNGQPPMRDIKVRRPAGSAGQLWSANNPYCWNRSLLGRKNPTSISSSIDRHRSESGRNRWSPTSGTNEPGRDTKPRVLLPTRASRCTRKAPAIPPARQSRIA